MITGPPAERFYRLPQQEMTHRLPAPNNDGGRMPLICEAVDG
jgi:hypothetical protein